MLKLHNTESRKKVAFDQKTVRIYTCGPTVYNFAHIGNLRTYVFEDLLRRTFKYFGTDVTQVMNLTDVDDKTIKGALESNLSLDEFTKTYKDAFFQDLETLSCEKAEAYPAATDHIPEMIQMIEALIEKGVAYQGKDGSVFFRISAFPSYGRLSHLNIEELKEGASERTTTDEYEKESVSDFVLWKAYDEKRDGPIHWDSPFGRGRPGWHIECSAMAIKHLGETLDIHVGGVDNMFPHHENEIAQSEACTGACFAKHWMHSEHLIVNGKKMSKSLGNFYTLRDLIEQGYTGPEVRYLLLTTHYRTQLNFTLDGLKAARSSLKRIEDFLFRLQGANGTDSNAVKPLLEKAHEQFSAGIADDLNISVSIAALFDLIRDTNTLIDESKVSSNDASEIITLLHDFDRVLAFIPFIKENTSVDAEKLLLERNEARAQKDYARSDALRDELLNLGFTIEDTPDGSRLKPIN
ncbi:MAG: Cysteine--tRNA ligase [Chlamydiia bacterium]|nr:Cysteine--tRNA ligase [Chlamydiia bacterium]MCH9615202.1 Cysteine--tRNA ligase [Chlamydiia bacterium]MCH9628476.1 Cysteine--tRNA ligase [Chlamydiia bacterium]